MILKIIIGAYSFFMAAWFFTYLFWLDKWWPLILLNIVGYYLFWPALPILFVALFLYFKQRQDTRYIYMAIVPVLIFVFFFHPFLKPNIIETHPNSDLRVLTYNILNGNRRVNRIVSVIGQVNADVVAIQELTERLRPKIIDRLSETYPYHYVSTPMRSGTTALFSKLPLAEVAELDFGVDRPAVVASTLVDGKKVTVVSAHLNPIYYALTNRPIRDMPRAIERYIVDQNKQAKLLIDVLRDYDSSAFILACDCNSRETASTNRILATFFKDAATQVGWALGDTPIENARHERDLKRVDYIWYTGAIETTGVYRLADSGGSDHQPVFSDFRWQ
ncbi:MAG: endonuclease/exonuclease/phosphatase family protein [Cyanobacteria bacterium J06639_14]